MREWLGFPKKDKYMPSPAKRYEVSKDEFSAKRILALRDIHHQLEEEFGVPLSLSIKGSLVKGKVLTPEIAHRADMDICLDLDSEALPKLENPRERLRTILISRLEAIKQGLGYSRLDSEHMRVEILNDRSFPDAVNKYNDKSSTFVRGRKNAEIHLASLFTLSIGSVVKKYRNRFLSELANMADQTKAELTWQTIRRVVEKSERKGEIPEKIEEQFPQTLEEALKFYGVRTEAEK